MAGMQRRSSQWSDSVKVLTYERTEDESLMWEEGFPSTQEVNPVRSGDFDSSCWDSWRVCLAWTCKVTIFILFKSGRKKSKTNQQTLQKFPQTSVPGRMETDLRPAVICCAGILQLLPYKICCERICMEKETIVAQSCLHVLNVCTLHSTASKTKRETYLLGLQDKVFMSCCDFLFLQDAVVCLHVAAGGLGSGPHGWSVSGCTVGAVEDHTQQRV